MIFFGQPCEIAKISLAQVGYSHAIATNERRYSYISFSLSSPLSLPFPLRFFTCSPFSANDLAPRSRHVATAPKYSRPGRQVETLQDISDGTLALRLEDCALRTWHLRRGHALPCIHDRFDRTLSSFLNKPQSYLLFLLVVSG